MTLYQHILIISDNFEIVSLWALFGPETAVVGGCYGGGVGGVVGSGGDEGGEPPTWGGTWET